MINNSHNLNEKLKRLEPIETQCAFCTGGKVTNVDSCLFTPLYTVLDRTILIVYNSVKFSEILVGIPRCYNCRNKHQSLKEKPKLWAFIVCIAILIYLIYEFDFVLGFFFGIPLIFVGVILQIIFKAILEQNIGISTELEVAEKDMSIQSLINEGWSLRKPYPSNYSNLQAESKTSSFGMLKN